MKDLQPYVPWLRHWFDVISKWLFTHVISWDSLLQISIAVVIFFIARFLAGHSAGWLDTRLKKPNQRHAGYLHESYKEIFFLIFLVVLLWFAAIAIRNAKLPFYILRTAASLSTAWAVIRLTSNIIKSLFWSRIFAVVLWCMAALNIVGWLGRVTEIMGKTAVTVGNFRLSLLLVVKSLFAFSILLWTVKFLSTLLQRIFQRADGLTPSQRVLFFKLSNIFLYAVGIIVGMDIVGIDLTTLTMFSGALGLGIGFGLQKVFSNLMSGIILLLDKSIKPGDVISVGDTFGWVNSLGARHVSVLTRDGKEHLIPNENLITQTVENWSYTDKKVRIRIPVGVSYAADMALVRKLLLQSVTENRRILKDPEPVCYMTGFGDSTVNHLLLVWISDPSDGVANVMSETYYRIWDLFKEHKVELPFPQRDVHLKVEKDSPVIQALRERV